MPYLAVDANGDEYKYNTKPMRHNTLGMFTNYRCKIVRLRNGTIEKLIGRKLTWEDEPVEFQG